MEFKVAGLGEGIKTSIPLEDRNYETLSHRRVLPFAIDFLKRNNLTPNKNMEWLLTQLSSFDNVDLHKKFSLDSNVDVTDKLYISDNAAARALVGFAARDKLDSFIPYMQKKGFHVAQVDGTFEIRKVGVYNLAGISKNKKTGGSTQVYIAPHIADGKFVDADAIFIR